MSLVRERGNIYRHFPSKNGVTYATAIRWLNAATAPLAAVTSHGKRPERTSHVNPEHAAQIERFALAVAEMSSGTVEQQTAVEAFDFTASSLFACANDLLLHGSVFASAQRGGRDTVRTFYSGLRPTSALRTESRKERVDRSGICFLLLSTLSYPLLCFASRNGEGGIRTPVTV